MVIVAVRERYVLAQEHPKARAARVGYRPDPPPAPVTEPVAVIRCQTRQREGREPVRRYRVRALTVTAWPARVGGSHRRARPAIAETPIGGRDGESWGTDTVKKDPSEGADATETTPRHNLAHQLKTARKPASLRARKRDRVEAGLEHP